MKHLVNMIRYLKIYSLFVRNSVKLFMSHRFNFLMGILANTVWTISQLVSLRFLFDKINTFQGWSYPDLILLLAFGQIYVYGSYMIYDINLSNLPKKVISGDFDRMLTKPINIKFLSSFETIAVAQFIPMLVTVTPLLVYGLVGRQTLTVFSLLTALALCILGVIAFFFLSLALIGLTFFIENALSIKDFLAQRSTDLSRIPVTFFPKAIQYTLTFIIPLAFVTYYPVLIIQDKINLFMPILTVLAITAVFYFLQKWIWKKGLINYSGVG
ncbi:MAG: ABC-2 family transporter protein [Microgenomates group bacterium]